TPLEDSVLYIHRTLPGGEIYFISNQANRTISIAPEFRVTGRSPELWNAIDGSVRDLPEFTISDSGTVVPVKLAAYESAFVIFRKDVASVPKSERLNFSRPRKTLSVTGTWKVQFDPDSRGPAAP